MPWVVQEDMGTDRAEDRPDIAAQTRGGDTAQRMDSEPDPAGADPEMAAFWRDIYTEILAMEEAVLERIRELQSLQSPEARQEVELTNVPVIVAQVERFRARLSYWQVRVDTPD